MSDNYRHEDDEDLRGAAETASRHAGDSGDTSLFGGILNAIGQNKGRLEQEDIDEDGASLLLTSPFFHHTPACVPSG